MSHDTSDVMEVDMATLFKAPPVRKAKFKANPQAAVDRNAILARLAEEHKNTLDDLAR